MPCICNIFHGKERNLSQEEVWNKILGIRQKCTLTYCGTFENGKCINKEYYEQFTIGGVVISCCSRADNHLLNVTKRIGHQQVVEKRRVPLPTGIRD